MPLRAAEFPSGFRRIELVSRQECSYGLSDLGRRFTFVVPIDRDGRLTCATGQAQCDCCIAIYRPEHCPPRMGHLRASGDGWIIHYDDAETDADDCKLADPRFLVGDYVSIEDSNGIEAFRVLSVGPIS